MGPVNHSRILTTLASLLLSLCLSAVACADELKSTRFNPEYDKDGRYISVDLLPLCTAEGQLIIKFTNVSDQDLLVDPRYMRADLFDAYNAGIDLISMTAEQKMIDGVKIGRIKNEHPYEAVDWFPLAAGQIVQHVVDLRDYVKEPLDFSLIYLPGFTTRYMEILTTKEGKHVIGRVGNFNDPLEDLIYADCWK
ncbi:hypothetical protein [Shewanella sedimentimangrovi]|uniref:Uncharacterized protein n=1 Tax=Shewanella sedimentimangrovi TaxID=2814293 RepID=A0ABX7R175_9GAMM|nr:hypothetical protein [Shewanella sedimentimangrovi]QSX36620.1 hypothetical protein JYB85_15235 [Shewanella sedimentimangrovi]